MQKIPNMVLTEGASGQCVDSKSKGFQLGLHAPKEKRRKKKGESLIKNFTPCNT